MKKSILAYLLLGCFVPIKAQPRVLPADKQGHEEVQARNALASATNASAARRTHDIWRLDAGHSTASLFLGSRANQHAFHVGIARVSGNVFLDRTKPANSEIDLVLYPADAGGPTGLDGKLAGGRSPNAIDYSELIFKSGHIERGGGDALSVTGDLTLVRIERSVDATPSEAYAGPIYGDPVVHTIEHQATFILRNLSPDRRRYSHGAPELSASTYIPHEDFPGLRSAMLRTSWPVVVIDEKCQMPASVGEDYAGQSCTGKTVSVQSQTLTPTGIGEDYHGFEEAPPTGSRVTIDFDLAMVPAASSLSQGRSSGRGGQM